MPAGIEVETEDGFATITFLDRSLRGRALAKLLDLGGPELIDVDTSGTHRRYRVPESIAADAGLIDAPAPAKAPRKPRKAAPKPDAAATPATVAAAPAAVAPAPTDTTQPAPVADDATPAADPATEV